MARQNNYPIFENNSTVITAEFLNGLVNNVKTLNQEDGVFDISIANAVSGVPITYNSLELALSGTSIPVDVRKGGMAVKFINSGTGKYEQWNLKASSWSTNTSDWALDLDGSVANGKLKLPFELEKPSSNEYVTQSSQIGHNGEPLADALTRKMDVHPGKNLMNPSAFVEGKWIQPNGIGDVGVGIGMSNLIPISNGETLTVKVWGGGKLFQCRFALFDANRQLITSSVTEAYGANDITGSITGTAESKYAAFTLRKRPNETDYKVQIESASSPTDYEPYTDYQPLADLKNELEDIDARVDVLEEKIENGLDDAFIVLPNTLYIKKNQRANIYFKQFIQSSDYGNEYSVSQFIRNGIGGTDISATFMPAYERQFSGTPSAAKTYPAVYYLRRYNKLIDTWTGNIISSDIPSTAQTINVLTVGGSITDIGNYQRRLIELLYDDNVTINYIGTMGYKEYEHGIVRMEALGGGNMSFMTEHNGNAKILTVSGITELPVTSYPGTSYQDANGNNWVVRGFKMEKQANNTYSGLLKLGVFKSDPNYGDGSQSGSESGSVFPSSGTITKVNNRAGDTTITYTAVTEARFNPFWNPAIDQLDFEYYLNLWNFESPDVLIMQWGFNEVGLFIDIDHQSISTAVSRAKTIIDKFHAQLPNAKVIYGFDPYGAELPRSASSHRNDGKKYAVLNFEKKIIEEFSKPEYADFVIVVPTSAMVDNVYGYGAIIEENINPVYPSVTVKRLANGHDGVHPPYGYALNEAALAYEAVLLSLI